MGLGLGLLGLGLLGLGIGLGLGQWLTMAPTSTNDDLLWVAWVALGSLVNIRATMLARRDFIWIRDQGANGDNLRDAREALWQNMTGLSKQFAMLGGGVWRLWLEPDSRWWWDVPDKMMVSTLVIIIVSTLTTYRAYRDLRNRRAQVQSYIDRKEGKRRTRRDDNPSGPSGPIEVRG